MSTLITDILTTMDARYEPPTAAGLTPEVSRGRAAWHERRLSDAHREAKLKAYAAFAALNGWKVDYSSLHPDALGRRSRESLYNEHGLGTPGERLFDHDVNFRADGKNVAILTQPYDHVDLDAVRTWAVGRGLEAHVPPDPLASVHYPGETYFIVITKPGVTVKWLPDQDGRLADRWQSRCGEAA